MKMRSSSGRLNEFYPSPTPSSRRYRYFADDGHDFHPPHFFHCDFYVYAGNGNRRFQAQGEHGEGTFQGEHPDWHYPAGNYSHQRDPGKPLFVANHFEADDERGSG